MLIGAELIDLITCHFELIDREWLFKAVCFYRWFCLLSAAAAAGGDCGLLRQNFLRDNSKAVMTQ